MPKVRIKQVRSSIDRSQKQKRTLTALGLKKINGTVEHELTATIRGMINKVSHLVEVSEIDQSEASQNKSAATTASPQTVAAPATAAVLEEE